MEIKNTYNLFLDDIREARDAFNYTKDVRFNLLTWIVVRSHDEFIKVIEEKFGAGEFPMLIALDHDLNDSDYSHQGDNIDYNKQEKTGFHSARWLVDFCMDNTILLPEYTVHSQNPAGKTNILGLLDGFKKFQSK